MPMDLVDTAVDAYMEDLLPARDRLLARLEAEAVEEGIPIVGPQVGTLLWILATLRGVRRAVELGTAIGYSAIWLARAMVPGGELHTVERHRETAERARRNLAEAGLEDQVTVHVGRARDVLPTLGVGYDLVFNDVDKEGYPDILPLGKRALKPGGLLVTDNVLWSGRVAQTGEKDAATEAIRTYNRRLAEDEEMATVIVPLRDGVSISLKRR